MDALIAERVARANLPRSVSQVWRRLAATDGRIALGPLATEIDLSRRTLIANFRACVGFPPKTIARLMRFNRAVRSFDRIVRTTADEPAGTPYIEACDRENELAGAVPWADIASDCGYFDQAHFIRDFREFAGHTPTAFLRNLSHLN
jgi:AraC-like DNA-binding protein